MPAHPSAPGIRILSDAIPAMRCLGGEGVSSRSSQTTPCTQVFSSVTPDQSSWSSRANPERSRPRLYPTPTPTSQTSSTALPLLRPTAPCSRDQGPSSQRDASGLASISSPDQSGARGSWCWYEWCWYECPCLSPVCHRRFLLRHRALLAYLSMPPFVVRTTEMGSP